jgi:hypothetical protein
MCVASSGVGGGMLIINNTYNAQGYSCGAFEDKACDIDNSYSSGVSTGHIISFNNVSENSRRPVISASPFGAVERVPSRR